MCGILGIVNFDAAESVDRGVLQSMADIIGHRGHDDEGFYIDRNVGLAHNLENILLETAL